MKQYTILTKNGLNKLISASANQTTITLKYMAVGDGSGEINQDATALQNERHRFAINAITINQNDSNILEVEGVLQADIGGFYVREAGIFCDDGSLFAIAKVAESYKPLLAEGSAKDITISFQIQISNTNLINLKVDNNVVLATRKWVLASYLPLNGKAADSYKLGGIGADSFVKTKQNLPIGDMKSKDFWKSQKSGFYFAGSGHSGTNKPAPSGLIQVVGRDEGDDRDYEKTVLWFDHTSKKTFMLFCHKNSPPLIEWIDLDKKNEDRFVLKTQVANNTKAGIVKFKNSVDGNAEDTAVSEKAVKKAVDNMGNTLTQTIDTKTNEIKNQIIGINQTWQDVTSNRRQNTVYTNSTGKPIFVSVVCLRASELKRLVVDGQEIDESSSSHGNHSYGVQGIVPNGSTYKVVASQGISKWFELR